MENTPNRLGRCAKINSESHKARRGDNDMCIIITIKKTSRVENTSNGRCAKINSVIKLDEEIIITKKKILLNGLPKFLITHATGFKNILECVIYSPSS